MYKFLLANRYLRTRFIALASVISVTLGVATMIVVNSVMSGFGEQMRDRIHNILADVTIESTSTDGTESPQQLIDDVRRLAGDEITAITPAVEMYGMMSFTWAGQTIYRPITLIGIVPETKNDVSPLSHYLLSRQAIEENGELIRPALRSMHAPLDWSLTEEDMKVRERWIRLKQLNEMEMAFRNNESLDFLADEKAEPAQGESELAGPPAAAPASGDEFGAIPETVDPFDAPETPLVQRDPRQPLAGRLFVGAGLVSFPYKDRETGQTHTMYMVQPGQDVVLTTIKTGILKPATFEATIVDIFKSKMSEYDSNLVFCNLEELQFVRGMLSGPDPTRPHENLDWRQGSITTLQLKLKDYSRAENVVRRLRAGLPPGSFQIRTWEQKQGPLLEAVAVESAILNVLLFLIIAVAGFGILAIFYMIVVEKTRDIGILKALGASSRGVMTIFLSYGLSLGIVGSGAGVVLGLLFVHYINEIEALLSHLTGRKVFDEAIYYFNEIPTSVQPLMVIWVALGAMFIAVLASVLPARRASRLHPVQALRYE